MDNFFDLTVGLETITFPIILVNIVLAFTLSLAIAWVYKSTHKGISYSQSFTFTLVLIGFLIAVIMMVIGNSVARAFGAFGAFSLIRFRTAIKDPKDVSFILLTVAVGLAVGTGNYAIAVVTTIFSILVIFILNKVNFGSIRKYDFVLAFTTAAENFSNEKLREIFKEYLKYDNLLNVSSRDSGKVLDYSFNIKFVNASEIDKFLAKLNQIEGISNADLVSAKNDIEY